MTEDNGATAETAIRPKYGAISAVGDICEPWIEIWGGDEWGESMHSLLGATKPNYGLSSEDCAVLAEMLLRNMAVTRKWMEDEGHSLGISPPEREAVARAEATRAREYWLRGGNLGDYTTADDAKSVIDTMPDWMFNAE